MTAGLGGAVEIATFIATFGLVVTKVVDTVRNVIDQAVVLPKWVWNIVAFAIGIAIATIFDVNVLRDFATNHIRGVSGQVITGILLGAGSGAWHEFLDRKQGKEGSNGRS